jgi:Signal transduction histidine kinase
VAHEIRSPLSSILMQLEVVRDGLAGPVTPKQTEILERVASRVQSLVDMASELLDLSRIEAGLLAEEREAVDLVPLVRERLEQLIPLAEQKQLTLSFEAQPAEALLTASRRAMEEVVDNLVSNAIKYTPEGGSVTVTLQSSDAEWILAVADTGFGIPPEDQENVFRRFYRVRSPETRTIMGTGLGLPIVKRIVEAHRGRIQLQSTPGAGSTFTLYLPR